jgi:hypothetical protein
MRSGVEDRIWSPPVKCCICHPATSFVWKIVLKKRWAVELILNGPESLGLRRRDCAATDRRACW